MPAQPSLASPQSGNVRGRSPTLLFSLHKYHLPPPPLFTFLHHPLPSACSLSPVGLASLAQLPAHPCRPGSLARTLTHTWTTPKAAMITLLATAATPHSRFCSLLCSKFLSLLVTRTRPSKIVAPCRSHLCWLSNALTLLVHGWPSKLQSSMPASQPVSQSASQPADVQGLSAIAIATARALTCGSGP